MELSRTQAPSQKSTVTAGLLGGVVLIGLLIGSLRYPTLYGGPGRDGGGFSYIGSRIVTGEVMYRDLWDHKPPFIHYLNAALFSAGNSDVSRLARFEMVWLGLIALLQYRVARHLFSPAVALGVTLLTTLYLSTLEVIEHFGMTETYAIAWVLTSVLCLWRWQRSPQWWWLVGSGIGVSLAFLTRQTTGVIAVPLGLYLLVVSYNRSPQLGSMIRHVGWWLAGIGAPLLLVAGYFASQDAWSDFWAQVIGFNQQYAAAVSFGTALRQIPWALWESPLSSWPALLLIAGLGLLARGAQHLSWREAGPMFFLAGWLLGDLVMLALGGRYYEHYFAQLIPALALLAGYALALAERWWRQHLVLSGWWVLLVLVLSPVLADIQTSWQTWQAVQTGTLTLTQRFGPEKAAAIKWITANTTPGETIYFWGAEPELNLITQRPSPSKYSYIYPFLVPGYAGESDKARFIGDFEQHQPRYVIDTSTTNRATPSLASDTGELIEPLFSTEAARPVIDYIRSHYQWQEKAGEWDVYRRQASR
jgi:4-amino-4-deoxy-L-arabinose transferase-like glycosyltransferase